MKITRILALGTILTLSFGQGLMAQTQAANDSDESNIQTMEDKAAPAEDKVAPATDQQTTNEDGDQKGAPSTTDDSKSEM
jgi:hypothetical protein